MRIGIDAAKAELVIAPPDVFTDGHRPASPAVDVKTLRAKIGQLALENDSLEHMLGKADLLSAKR